MKVASVVCGWLARRALRLDERIVRAVPTRAGTYRQAP
jgi:hypothetical protein